MKNILAKKKKQNKSSDKKTKKTNKEVEKKVTFLDSECKSNDEEKVVSRDEIKNVDSSSSEEEKVDGNKNNRKTEDSSFEDSSSDDSSFSSEEEKVDGNKNNRKTEDSSSDDSSSSSDNEKVDNNKNSRNTEDSSSDDSSSSSEEEKIKGNKQDQKKIDDSSSSSEEEEAIKKKETQNKVDDSSSDFSSSSEEATDRKKTADDESSSIEEVSSSFEDPDDETKDKRLVFIRGIPYNLDDESVKKELKKLGRVVRVSVPTTREANRNKGFCFVEFLKEVDAKKCLKLNEKELFGRKISVSYANSGENKAKFTIKVNNLPFVIDKDEFKEFISQYGECARVAVPFDNETERCLGFAFLTYEDEEVFKKVLKTSMKYKDRTLYLRDGSAVRQESKDKFDIRKKQDYKNKNDRLKRDNEHTRRNNDSEHSRRKNDNGFKRKDTGDYKRKNDYKQETSKKTKKEDYKHKSKENKTTSGGNRIVFDSDSE